MKIVLIGAVLLAGFVAYRMLSASSKSSSAESQTAKPTNIPDSTSASGETRLHAHVAALTGTSKPRNSYNLDALNEAAAYIFKQFTSYGFKATEQKYRASGNEYKNILASYGPADAAERIVIGAHYDVAGEMPGADDNASGIAGLLEIARLFSVLKPDTKYRVDFVAFTLEEPPHFGLDSMGSNVHAKSLRDAGVKLRGMVCLEMIGYYSDAAGSQRYPVPGMEKIYPDKGNYIAVVSDLDNKNLVEEISTGIKSGSLIPVETLNAPASVPGVGLSDHRNYWEYDYPSVMITNTAFLRNPNYHEPTDTIETLDFKRMSEVVKGVYYAVVNLK
jgi:Zn-dependent M28 family amino/carboxypeptidase